MRSSPCNPLQIAAAIEKSLSLRGIAQACPIALSAVLAATGLSFATNTQAGNTYIVTTAGDPGLSGTLSLRQAIATANSSAGNTIQFAPALVGSTITLASGQIAIQQAMTIAGPGADLITISGNNASRVFYIRPIPDDSNPDHTPVTISGVTLTHGNIGGSGGAVFTIHTRLVLTHSTVSASKAQFGGGIYSLFGKPMIEYSRLTGNQASLRGGAFYSAQDASVYIGSDTISGNSAGEQGGGMLVAGTPTLQIQASTISGNAVPQPQPGSGAQGGGGVALRTIGFLANIRNSTITQNYAATGGAGVALLDAQTGNATLINYSTIAGNTAGVDETGIGITSAGGSAQFFASIASNNFSQSSADDLAGAFVATDSLIKNPGGATITGSGSLIGVDAQLGSLVDNGGATLTMLPAVTSPVIGKVPCDCSTNHFTDQRGIQRHDQTDMGAVERHYPEDLIFRNGFAAF
jgi:predicted outer membrane repeat protein